MGPLTDLRSAHGDLRPKASRVSGGYFVVFFDGISISGSTRADRFPASEEIACLRWGGTYPPGFGCNPAAQPGRADRRGRFTDVFDLTEAVLLLGDGCCTSAIVSEPCRKDKLGYMCFGGEGSLQKRSLFFNDPRSAVLFTLI